MVRRSINVAFQKESRLEDVRGDGLKITQWL
jgi:hypothetical protein